MISNLLGGFWTRRAALVREGAQPLHDVGVGGEQLSEPVEERDPPTQDAPHQLLVGAAVLDLVNFGGVLSRPVRVGDEQGFEAADSDLSAAGSLHPPSG